MEHLLWLSILRGEVAFTAGINYTDRKTCKAIYGEVCLPNTPTVTGYVGANQCGCPRVVSGGTTATV